jgi:hypothetical protein
MTAIEGVRVWVPTRGTVEYQTAAQLQAIRDANPGLPPVEFQAGRHSVTTVRNAIRERFLAGSGQVLVMVDDDVVPHPQFLQALDAMDRFGVVGWPVPIVAEFGMGWNIDGPVNADDVHRGVASCERIGFGAAAIRRDVLEQVQFRDGELELWEGDAIQLPPEDWDFCDRARAAGFDVGVDSHERAADHIGQHTSSHLSRLLGQYVAAWSDPQVPVSA